MPAVSLKQGHRLVDRSAVPRDYQFYDRKEPATRRAFSLSTGCPANACYTFYMRPIPIAMREEIASDPFMKRCCLWSGVCEGRIEWHHNLIFAGKQVNERWAILPLCTFHHDRIAYNKGRVDHIMLNRATDDELKRYSKAIDYISLREQLNKQYGTRS